MLLKSRDSKREARIPTPQGVWKTLGVDDHRTLGGHFREACYVTDDAASMVWGAGTRPTILSGYDLDVKGTSFAQGIADEIIREAKRFGCYVETSPSGEGYLTSF